MRKYGKRHGFHRRRAVVRRQRPAFSIDCAARDLVARLPPPDGCTLLRAQLPRRFVGIRLIEAPRQSPCGPRAAVNELCGPGDRRPDHRRRTSPPFTRYDRCSRCSSPHAAAPPVPPHSVARAISMVHIASYRRRRRSSIASEGSTPVRSAWSRPDQIVHGCLCRGTARAPASTCPPTPPATADDAIMMVAACRGIARGAWRGRCHRCSTGAEEQTMKAIGLADAVVALPLLAMRLAQEKQRCERLVVLGTSSSPRNCSTGNPARGSA